MPENTIAKIYSVGEWTSNFLSLVSISTFPDYKVELVSLKVALYTSSPILNYFSPVSVIFPINTYPLSSAFTETIAQINVSRPIFIFI